jgi:hypothetical protein
MLVNYAVQSVNGGACVRRGASQFDVIFKRDFVEVVDQNFDE